MAKLVDALAPKANGEIRVGSSPTERTMIGINNQCPNCWDSQPCNCGWSFMKKEPETEFDFELDYHSHLLAGIIISALVVGLGVFLFHKHKRKVKDV